MKYYTSAKKKKKKFELSLKPGLNPIKLITPTPKFWRWRN
jgi:hypothetical protein